MPKPTLIQYYDTPSGPVKTLAEWKHASLVEIFERVDKSTAVTAAKSCLAYAEQIVEILSHREKGRPTGAKDRKPRIKKATEPSVVQAA